MRKSIDEIPPNPIYYFEKFIDEIPPNPINHHGKSDYFVECTGSD